MRNIKRRVPTWIYSEAEFELRNRSTLQRLSRCYFRAWRRCRRLPRQIPGLTETGLWECLRSAVIAAVRLEFAEAETEGRARMEDRKGLFLLHVDGFSYRFNHVNDKGLPSTNDTKQTKQLNRQRWLFIEVETDSTITIVAGQRAEPSMTSPPDVVFTLLLDDEEKLWSLPYGTAADAPQVPVLASIVPKAKPAAAVAAAEAPKLRSKIAKRRGKSDRAGSA